MSSASRFQRRVLPPVYFLLALLATAAADRLLPIVELVGRPWSLIGVLPAGLGLGIAIIAARQFAREGTPVKPFTISTALVTGGVYRYTRNPMYLGMLLVLLGVAVSFGSLGALLPLPVLALILEFRFVRPEEDFLRGIFGERYDDYRRRVRRWV